MIRSGLVSITFRKLSPREIVDLVAKAGLDGIEWGGDIHAPHGDVAKAREVAAMTRDAGLRVAAYGSYYTVGHEEAVKFEAVLDSAQALGATVARVWAGKKHSVEADAAYRDLIVSESQRIADLAAKRGITVAYEFHRKTLTDTDASAAWLLKTVDRANVRSYWQPRVQDPVEKQLAGLEAVFPWLSHIHCFYWEPLKNERLFLEEGAADWKRYLERIRQAPGDRFMMIEFVKGDAPENFLRDAGALQTFLRAK